MTSIGVAHAGVSACRHVIAVVEKSSAMVNKNVVAEKWLAFVELHSIWS